MVNTLIHCDFNSSKNIKIIREQGSFHFFNPGRLRIPLKKLYQGGVSDCRNPNLQRMFGLIGWGERAGSGFQKIFKAWELQHWINPIVFEDMELHATYVILPLVSLVPEKISNDLIKRFGDNFKSLSELERALLVLTSSMGHSKNESLRQFRNEHPSEITKALQNLVDRGFLKSKSYGRGMEYSLVQKSFEHLDEKSNNFNKLYKEMASVREKPKLSKSLIESKVLQICRGRFVSLRVLEKLLNRNFNTLRNHYINPLIKQGKLVARYPEQQRHPHQAYKTAD